VRERAVHCTCSGTLLCNVVGRILCLSSSFEQQNPCEGPNTGKGVVVMVCGQDLQIQKKGGPGPIWPSAAHKSHTLNT